MRTTLLILIVLAISACDHNIKRKSNFSDNVSPSLDSFMVDTSRIAIIPFDTTSNWLFEDAKPISLNQIELRQIEEVLASCIKDFNASQKRRFEEISAGNSNDELHLTDFTIDLNEYLRQYISATNKEGEKVVWVNCFCGEWGEGDKYRIILVDDGGKCYFNLIINLATKTCIDFFVNGDA